MDDAQASNGANTGSTRARAVGHGVARREGRGFVTSYGEGRSCASSGCTTALSRYNSDSQCWLHQPDAGNRRG